MYYVWTEDTIRLALLLLLLLLLMLASILAFFPLFELHLLHLLLLLLLYSLCAFWQCCLMLMSAIECGASVIFFLYIFPQLVLPLARFWLLSCPLASYSIHWLFVVSVLSSATISNSNTNTIPLANIVVMSRPLTHSLTPSRSLSVACSAFKIQFGNRIWLLRVCCCSASSSVCLPFCVYIEIISSIYAHLFIDGSHSFASSFPDSILLLAGESSWGKEIVWESN